MLSRIVSQAKPNSSLVITGAKMLCAANLRHFTNKKDMVRPYKPPQSIRPDRKSSYWAWDPFIDEYDILHPFQLEMEKHLRDLHSKFGQYFGDAEFPACSTDIKENTDNYEIHMDLPGVKKEDISIKIKDNVLTINGERKYSHTEGTQPSELEKSKDTESEPNEVEFYRRERYHGKFVRRIALPQDVEEDATQIMATYHDGVLNINVPKKDIHEPDHEAHSIKIL
eukprot:CAMPEP_0201568564 /NCGR_PEP_ID=MMETSP0190_2-20130828/9708_1 /ASSEMBLY_ACC=CAM_ASM_000263 /TAXON_ID=37353 /ORGANISM="Rosalina sp." /LENGTH=224 /DNA_ID=CAMNT_0047989821 /DNA_START=9 /DNA_END=683 /DNA_ORIENTATION=-